MTLPPFPREKADNGPTDRFPGEHHVITTTAGRDIGSRKLASRQPKSNGRLVDYPEKSVMRRLASSPLTGELTR